MLRFSSGMIPLGSLSWTNENDVNDSRDRASGFFTVTEEPSCTHCGVLKVVQTVVCEDKPPPLPGFNSSPCGANSQHQNGSAKEKARETTTEAPGWAADRQTDVCADRQMTPFTKNIPLFTLIHHGTVPSPSPQLHSLQLSGYFSFSPLICWFS